jgi:anti-anti-sigma regulatory factor
MHSPLTLPDTDMAVTAAADADSDVVHLPANGGTVTAEELRNQLVCASEIVGATTIDGSAVQTIGQAVLQLLLAARRGADAAGKSFTIIHPSAPLLEAARACCLAEAIGLETGKATAL